jgi:hypothetical protein
MIATMPGAGMAAVPVAGVAVVIMAMPVAASAIPDTGIAIIAAIIAAIRVGAGVAAGEARQEHGARQEPSGQCQSHDLSPSTHVLIRHVCLA